MKIGMKLALAFGALVVLILSLGTVSIVEMKSINTGYTVDVKLEETSIQKALSLYGDFLQVRRNEKDFLARKDTKYVDRLVTYLDRAEKDARELQEITSHENIEKELTQALQDIDSYRNVFAALVKASEEKGLNEKLGLQGEFRGAAHSLNSKLAEYDTSKIQYWALMLRRYEKDISINRDNQQKSDKYMTKLGKAGQNMHQTIKASTLKNDLKNKLNNKINDYLAAVSSWHNAIKNQEEGDYAKVRSLAHDIEEMIKNHYVDQAEVIYLAIRKDEKDYMLRGNKKYVERVHKNISGLLKNIDLSLIQDSEKEMLRHEIASYKKAFNSLVTIDDKIAEELTRMKVSADEVMAIAEDILKHSEESAAEKTAHISAMAETATNIVWAVIAFCTILAVILAWLISRHLTVPLGKTVLMLNELGRGHLDMRLKMARKDEIGEMANTMDSFADVLQNQIVNCLQKLAAGDLTFEARLQDDKDVIGQALQKTGEDLNRLVGEISMATSQIASGSNQVSSTSQSLSQGATEQAASIEEISSSMTQMSSQTNSNADNASQANQLATQARETAQEGNVQMEEMVEAMNEINESGQNISKIIKVIDEIAFQTNLLALNAAVEAARAGQHGKGFAVVAEEVRNLAARSAKAASETAEMIESSVTKTDRGMDIATQTSSSLGEIVNGISKVSDLVAEIATASREQSEGIGQVSMGISQVDQVTQSNTAAAEEGAAAAEELSSQSDHMRQLVSVFKVKGVAGPQNLIE